MHNATEAAIATWDALLYDFMARPPRHSGGERLPGRPGPNVTPGEKDDEHEHRHACIPRMHSGRHDVLCARRRNEKPIDRTRPLVVPGADSLAHTSRTVASTAISPARINRRLCAPAHSIATQPTLPAETAPTDTSALRGPCVACRAWDCRADH